MNLDNIKQPFLEIFPGDLSYNTYQRQTPKVLFSLVKPVGFDKPQLLVFNEKLSKEIGLGSLAGDEDFLVATHLPDHIKTYSTAYAGHQFGNWAGQLGDGRAILAGEIVNEDGQKTELQWKGAGATPYSRTADGRAVLRSSVREYLMSEAMHHLGVPTTRALSLSLTGENVIRDILYNGNPNPEKGAVVLRTAESFLRFGHFEWMSAQKEIDTLTELVDFTIENYYPEIDSKSEARYEEFFQAICDRTSKMIIEWLRVGFVHGVMNTDNMSILGLTIDYGPYSMLDEYNLNFTPNTTDLPGRRYAFGKQGQIAQWNLWQLANALFPIIKNEKFLENTLNNFGTRFWINHDTMLSIKFGFDSLIPTDEEFFNQWQVLMQNLKLDYTLFFHELEKGISKEDISKVLEKVSYQHPTQEAILKFEDFLYSYEARLEMNSISIEESKKMMTSYNPKFTLRNYLLYECIEELEIGKTEMLTKLTKALENPYLEIYPEFSAKRPSKYDNTTGCSTLSCSS